VWEIRVFTGRDEAGRPTQVSKTVRGTKREAKRAAAALESRPAPKAAGRTVAEVVDAWREVNDGVWSEATRRDYASRAGAIAKDAIGAIALARLGVADVERWHARMRHSGLGAASIRSRHGVLRAAIAQAVRWEWVGANVAAQARLRQARQAPRGSMSVEEVQAVIAAAREVDPLAALALRLAAVAGARRAELAALRWDDVDGDKLTIDSSVAERRGDEDGPELIDQPTKTANRRTVRLDAATVAEVEARRAERAAALPYMFSIDEGPASARARVHHQPMRAGIDPKWRLHDLRHWSATMAIGAGADVRTVAGRLGHANPAMTLRVYAHALDAADQAVAEQLGDLLDAGES